ncbi:hypothetical protein [Neisseria sp.]|uniref:hypothetical protein n=1 Tax=Neisseria sp. TaxID=192066 RepID=UPI00359FDF86
MDRRKFLLGITALSVSAVTGAAPDIGTFSGKTHLEFDDDAVRKFKPAIPIGNYKEDAHRIYMFISFSCPFCAQTWEAFAKWALALPNPYKFVYVPIFNGKVQNTAGTGFYIIRELAPTRTPEYLRLAFSLQQKRNTGTKDYIAILYQMGFTRQQIASASQSAVTQKRIARAMMLYQRYRVGIVNQTPVFGVAGKYLTHTGFTKNGYYKEVAENLSWLITDEIEKAS